MTTITAELFVSGAPTGVYEGPSRGEAWGAVPLASRPNAGDVIPVAQHGEYHLLRVERITHRAKGLEIDAQWAGLDLSRYSPWDLTMP